MDRCASIRPELAKARVVAHRVGTRLSRPEVRVEAEDHGTRITVLHNYGHSGSGVTLSWGCAREIVGMAATMNTP
ncbi:glycine/D-amino acid oxidase-like deaminating enzyme [Streptomyces sp. LBL]|nr:glycine/D-amino acid oxidase-like deaminating enzyme [Streptomyces sp. LBL]